MLIRSQCKDTIVNLDNVECISAMYEYDNVRGKIMAYSGDNKSVLGVYESMSRAISVLDEILSSYLTKSVFIMPMNE